MRVPLRIGLMVVLLVVAATCTTWATQIQNLLPGGANITFKISNFETGTRYHNLAVGHTYTDAEIALMPTADPGDPLIAWKTLIPGFESEDGYGTFQVSSIYNTDKLSEKFYTLGIQPFEITGLFWGLNDQEVLFDGKSQLIKSSDLHFAMFEDPDQDYLRMSPGDRIGNTFDTVTDGSLIWTGNSVVGDPDADPYEFYSAFTPGATSATDVGKGSGLANVGWVPTWGEGPLNWMIGEYSPGINFKFQFSADTDGAGPWPLASNDPIKTEITPELSSGGLMLLGMLPIGVAWFRRRKA